MPRVIWKGHIRFGLVPSLVGQRDADVVRRAR
jgi:hypothetical protein